MEFNMSYEEYLSKTNSEDSRQSWISWKTEVCGMEYTGAVRAAYDPEWGWR